MASFLQSIARIFRIENNFFPTSSTAKLIMLGLDAAGKTTVLYRIKRSFDEVVTTIPTIGFNVETLEFDRTNFTCWDVGGCDKIRPLWNHYLQDINAIVYVVDSNDRDRITSAKDEMNIFITNEHSQGVPLLVIANKQVHVR
jgi:ADP-ribosylation factor 1/2